MAGARTRCGWQIRCGASTTGSGGGLRGCQGTNSIIRGPSNHVTSRNSPIKPQFPNNTFDNWPSFITPSVIPMAAGVTPPGSISGRPLTPPPTEEKPLSTRTQAVINFFRRHREGSRPNAWTRYYIDSGDYERLLSLLDADKNLRSYIDDKVR